MKDDRQWFFLIYSDRANHACRYRRNINKCKSLTDSRLPIRRKNCKTGPNLKLMLICGAVEHFLERPPALNTSQHNILRAAIVVDKSLYSSKGRNGYGMVLRFLWKKKFANPFVLIGKNCNMRHA